jgi:hypothetical protein
MFILNQERRRYYEPDRTPVITGSDVYYTYYVKNNLLYTAENSGHKMYSSKRGFINL